MKRSIISIDEEKCNGCGMCVPACHEGAIRIVEGKARLVGDSLCDGLGACLGECPQGAITISEREADGYNEIEALENIMQAGAPAVQAHLKHLADHGQNGYLKQAQEYLQKRGVDVVNGPKQEKSPACGCPGSMARDFRDQPRLAVADPGGQGPVQSELRQWPVQLRLLNPHSSFFQDADLVVSADCVPFTFADFHRKFLKGKVLVIFCPKLDAEIDEYIEKLAEVFRANNIKTVTIVRMEVPCCSGTEHVVEAALRQAGKNIIIRGYTVSLQGDII